MAHNGYLEVTDKVLREQRVCNSCKGFVTFTRVDSNLSICSLCKTQVTSSPNLVKQVSAKDIEAMIRKKHSQLKSQ